MVAGALLAVGGTAVLSAYRTTMGLVEHQRRLSEGINVAASKLEELLRVESGDSSIASDGGPELLDNLSRPTTGSGAHVYEVSWTIGANRPSAGYIEIVMNVQWVESDGRVRRQRVAAYREE